ncbi:hypothetical protein Tco_0096784 [Tanacetum coccineum]
MSLSLAENMIVAGVDNRPPMLDKIQYSSWASRMLLYIKGKENKKLLVDSVLNGPFKYGITTVPDTQTTPATVRDKTYDELKDAEKIRESCDIKAINIILQGLLQDIYNLVNHHTQAKDIWIECSYSLKPEWSKFVPDVKLAKDLYITNFDHLFGYLRQHEAHANEVRLARTQVTIQNGKVMMQTVQGRQTQGYGGNGVRSNAKGSSLNRNGGTSIAEKAMLAEALESRVALDDEQMAFLANNRATITTGQASQELVTTSAF